MLGAMSVASAASSGKAPEAPAQEASAELMNPWGIEGGVFFSWLEDIDGGERVRAAGPFWEKSRGAHGEELDAWLRPLWSRAVDPVAGRRAWDALWPAAAGKQFGPQRSWRVATAFFLDADSAAAESKYHFWLLPVWGHGRTAEGKGYAALFPIGGTLNDFLWKDRFSFVLWPLWMRTEVGDVRTTDVLWPFFSRTTSEDGQWDKRRVFPLYSRVTNRRQGEKKTVLWPLWSQARFTHPKANGTAWILFPLAGRVNLNSQQGWMALPPLFQYVRGEQMTRLYCPWPLFQRETGPYRQRLYVWPFYGWRTDGELHRTFWAWPFVVREQNQIGRQHRVRWTVVPFLNCVTTSEREGEALPKRKRSALGGRGATAETVAAEEERAAKEAAATPAGQRKITARRVKVWPLFSHTWDAAREERRTRMLELWPGPNPAAVERSWAPLWTLADYRSLQGNSEFDVLWGLYRQRGAVDGARSFSLFPIWAHDRAEPRGERRWSFLKGLLAYDRTGAGKRVRFLWVGRWSWGGAAEDAVAEKAAGDE